MFGKNQNVRTPKLAGIDDLDIVTNETDVPVPYFAGTRRLDVSWIMSAIIDHTTNVGGGKGKTAAKSGQQAKNYFGHCAGMICQGQLDFIQGLLINNELVFPNAAIWDSQIFQKNRVILVTFSGVTNAYQTPAKTFEPPVIVPNPPPNPPWVLYATQWAGGGGGYATGALVVANGTMVFKSLINANTTTPPITATSNADWKYISSPENFTVVGATNFWDAGSIVAWEGEVYITPSNTNAQPPNAPWVIYSVLESGSPNPFLMTVAKSTRFGTNSGPGDWYLYWGLPNQTLDPTGEAILTSLGHPPYRNCAVIVGKAILFGTQTVQPPSVQLLAGRNPVQTLITGPAAALDSRGCANPWCVLAELLTHPILGLGLPSTWFDATTWNAEATHCYNNSSFFYISPMFTSLKKIAELTADLLGYPDAFIFWSTVATLMAGHWPHGEAPPAFGATNTINRNNIRKEFSTQSEGWWGTMNSVAVTISDIQAGFKSRPCLASNLFNMSVTKRLLSMKVDRPYITDYNQGLAWAHEFAKISGDQMSSGTIELMSEKATAVTPGSLFLLTDDVLGTSEVQRCTKRVISKPATGDGGITKLSHETERGIAPQPFQPTQSNPSQASGPAPSLIPQFQVAQLPTSLAGEGSTLALLASRADAITCALAVWFQQADGTAFQQLATQTGFAVRGTIGFNGTAQFSQLLTSNVVRGTTYNLPSGYLAFNDALFVYSGGGLIGATIPGAGILYAYTSDYTLDIINNTVTIPPGSSIPAGATITSSAAAGCIPTTNAVQGTTYTIPTQFWAPFLVFRMTAGQVASYTGGFGGATLCTEGQDFLIDPVGGTFTVVTGGNISAGETVFVIFSSMDVAFDSTTPAVDLDAISAPLTQDQIDDDDLLMFCFKAANPSLFEIMSVRSISAVTTFPSTNNYILGLQRQQFGTLMGGDGVTDFGANDFFFIVPRANLTPLAHEAFQGLEESGETANFILAPQSAWVDAAISDLYDPANNPSGLSQEFSYTFDNIFGPQVTWIVELKGGAGGTAISSYAAPFLTTDIFYFSFQLNAGPGANVTSASLVAGLGEQQITLWSNVYQPSPQVNASAQFTLPNAGLYTVFLNVLCDDGSQVSAPLTLPGSGTPVQIQINATVAPTPLLDTYKKVRNQITGLKFGVLPTGLTVLYQLQLRGTAFNNAFWSTAGVIGGGLYGPLANFQSGKFTLYAKCQQGGSTDSAVVSWNL